MIILQRNKTDKMGQVTLIIDIVISFQTWVL